MFLKSQQKWVKKEQEITFHKTCLIVEDIQYLYLETYNSNSMLLNLTFKKFIN